MHDESCSSVKADSQPVTESGGACLAWRAALCRRVLMSMSDRRMFAFPPARRAVETAPGSRRCPAGPKAS
eukprot:1746040-Rhodomonas_salina.2